MAVYIGLDGKVERQDLVECKFGDVDTISKFGSEPKIHPLSTLFSSSIRSAST
ncbi:hypothetical protein [Lysobacter gummosus]|uniref:hypothetical protein n=1 Tax=Lysobacter gummosus TaxID=262324 RepID=UPI00364163DA